MLYELIGIARPGNINEVREIVMSSGQLVLRNGGVIRSIANWGVFSLPTAITKHQARHFRGHYFVMRFDGSAKTHDAVRNTLKLDPRMIRTAFVKLGNERSLQNMARFGEVMWTQAYERS
ncbi:hypothetical protein SEUCBS139899_008111 [Sporothrix eucalyptigena]|uniref:Uncharacterized protein n=1 Tax=Sporothrix eucalyptigena TaxID=1812306 RepID=A0ABP0CH60_9PEZI